MAESHQAQLEKAKAHYREGLDLYRSVGDQWGRASALVGLAQIAWLEGDLDGSASLNNESVRLFRAVGDRWSSTFPLYGLGETARVRGDYEQSTTLFEESLVLYEELHDRRGVVWPRWHYSRAGMNMLQRSSQKGWPQFAS